MIYNDKSKEELEAALDQFIEGYSEKIGKVDLTKLSRWARDKYMAKVEAQIESSFGTLTPKSLEQLVNLINDRLLTAENAVFDDQYTHEEAMALAENPPKVKIHPDNNPELTYDQFMKLNENDYQQAPKKRGRKAKNERI